MTPVSPTPVWPTDYHVMDAVPSALGTQYPTVYGGIRVAPSQPGETPQEINSHFIFYETVRDPFLEAEVRSSPYYGPPPSHVTFATAPRSWACLQDIQTSIGKAVDRTTPIGETIFGWGISVPFDTIMTTACVPPLVQKVQVWVTAGWGDAVQLQTCQTIPTAN